MPQLSAFGLITEGCNIGGSAVGSPGLSARQGCRRARGDGGDVAADCGKGDQALDPAGDR